MLKVKANAVSLTVSLLPLTGVWISHSIKEVMLNPQVNI